MSNRVTKSDVVEGIYYIFHNETSIAITREDLVELTSSVLNSDVGKERVGIYLAKIKTEKKDLLLRLRSLIINGLNDKDCNEALSLINKII